jgi:sortase (surface protein transpeptidase)
MMNPNNNQHNLDTATLILTTITVLFGVHLLLSSVGLIPSEVSAFNNQVAQAVQSLHTIEYQQNTTHTEPQTVSGRGNDKSFRLPEAPQALPTQTGEKPQRITIDAIDVDTKIANPISTSLSVLNDALNESAVRYPKSGRIGSGRPMFLFGHSSRLPVVQNQAYKSFNGLNKLSVGDTITIHGSSTTAVYTVTSVDIRKADAGFVSFTPNDRVDLTISTCTTFGAEQNRTIVQAKRV